MLSTALSAVDNIHEKDYPSLPQVRFDVVVEEAAQALLVSEENVPCRSCSMRARTLVLALLCILMQK